MTRHLTGEHIQAMRAVTGGRIAWTPVPTPPTPLGPPHGATSSGGRGAVWHHLEADY